jgi:RimJ/RimL family protein N-acetyltransferase
MNKTPLFNVDEFRDRAMSVFFNIKHEISEPRAGNLDILLKKDGEAIAVMKPITVRAIDNAELIRLLAKWRQENEIWFPAQFKVTEEGTKKWLKEQVIEANDRFLFLLETPDGIPFGHVGLYRFNFEEGACEIDNILRGAGNIPGVMTAAVNVLDDWAFSVLGVRKLYLKVFSDNQRAIALYNRCGYKEIKKIPLKKVAENDMIKWIELPDDFKGKAERYFSIMALPNHKYE